MKRSILALAFALALASPAAAQVANGRATTSAPSYGNNTTAPLSLDTSGNLRTNCVSGCAGGNFNNNADGVATSATNGQTAAWLYGWNGASFDRMRGNTAGLYVQGNVAAASGSSANPVGIGGVYLDSGHQPTYATGKVTIVQTSSHGELYSFMTGINATFGDATANTAGLLPAQTGNAGGAGGYLGIFPFVFNGTTWDRTRGDATNGAWVNVKALPSNASVNVAQINGVTPLMGSGVTGTGSPRVTPASDSPAIANWGHGATGSAAPSGATQAGVVSSGNMRGLINCDNSAVYDASTNGSTQLVALQSGQTIYVCGYSILSAGTVNVELDYGTGSACATGTTKIVPAYQLTAQAGVVDSSPFSRGLKTAASNALCIKTSGAVAVQAIVYYTQF